MSWDVARTKTSVHSVSDRNSDCDRVDTKTTTACSTEMSGSFCDWKCNLHDSASWRRDDHPW